MYTVPSGRASATAIVGPIGACFMNGSSYVADSFLAADASAGATDPWLFSLVDTGVVFQSAFSRNHLNSSLLPGSPFHSVHFVLAATCCEAPIASHSVGATTPTRLPLTTTCAFGYRVLSSAPT